MNPFDLALLLTFEGEQRWSLEEPKPPPSPP